MTKWILLACISAFGSVCCAQLTKTVDYALIYDLSYIRDTSTNEYHHGYECLAIRAGDEGRFQDFNAHFNDSIILSFEERYPGLNTASLPKDKLNAVLDELDATMAKWQKPHTDKYRIIKDFGKGHSKMVSIYDLTPQHLEQPLAQDWQLTAVQDTLAGMRCYQATTCYGGRNYVAWYNPDIPISDGPYVFAGLPGLIVKISDEQNWYSFTLKRVSLEPHERFWNDYFMLSASTPVSREVFVQTMKERKENPKIPGLIGQEPEEVRLRRKNGFKKRFDLLLEQNN
ncbi:GLPGLI family protein [Neolewinella agarilytica]|nr:GLPGLI family protein [Neolewinella agarilytica]